MVTSLYATTYFVALQLYKVLKSQKPAYLYSKFAQQMQQQETDARRPVPFSVPLFNTTCFKKSYIVTAIYLWNKLPDPIRTSPSIPIFKSRLLAFLLKQNPQNFLNNLYDSNYSVTQFIEFDFCPNSVSSFT